jgi:hypothetical protein
MQDIIMDIMGKVFGDRLVRGPVPRFDALPSPDLKAGEWRV